jgi:hypothetical protein
VKHIAIIGGGDQENRKEMDFYPTPHNVTEALITFLNSKGVTYQTIHEPASGEGDISKVFESYFYEVISSDLRTENIYGLGGIDFLESDIPNCDACITNPPFNVAEKFIEKSVGNYRIIAMLLKSQYWHAKTRLPLFMKYPPSYVLPLTWRPDFLEKYRPPSEKGNPTMDVGWTVWIQGDTETKYQPLRKP